MSNPNTSAKVKSTLTKGQTVAQGLTALDAVCTNGAQCTAVQNSPVTLQALTGLKAAVATARTSLNSREQTALSLAALIKTLHIDYAAVRSASHQYEVCVNTLAGGDASIIHQAGLASRAVAMPPSPLGKVSVLHTKPGKHPGEAIITWPKAPGATGYALQANFTPQTPAGPWTALTPGTGRRRTVKGPTPGAQFLVQVASLGSGGTQADWSDPILAVAAY